MAERPAILTHVKNGLVVDWGTLSDGDTGEWVEVYDWPTLSPQPNNSSTVIWEGTNDTAKTAVVTPSFVSNTPASEQGRIFSRYRYVRPRASGGSFSAALFASRQV